MDMCEIVMLLLVVISTFGFADLFRAKLRLPLVVLFPFVQACQTVFMMMSGFFHCLTFSAWILLVVGDLLWLRRLIVSFKSNGGLLRNCYARLFRVEYMFVLCVSLVVYLFYSFNVFQDWSADFMYCWYNHYYYLLSKGKWVSADYTNYAHSYCMIGNAYASYLGNVLRNTGMNLYSYSMMLLSFGASLPLLAYVKWRQVSLEILVGVVALIWGRLFSGWWLWLIPLLFAVWMLRQFRKENLRKTLRYLAMNAMVLLVVGIVFMLNSYSYWTAVSYPFDSLLGMYALGILSIFLYGCYSPAHWWRVFPVEVVMLMVLTHIKPTGVIPAIFLALLISISSVIHLFRTRQGTSNRLVIARVVMIVLVLIVPLIMFFSWQGYCTKMGWKWHESFDKGKLVEHIHSGIPTNEFEAWRGSFVSGSGLMPPSYTDVPSKGCLMAWAEKAVGLVLYKVGLDPDNKFLKVCMLDRQNVFHHVACVILMIGFCGFLIGGMRLRKAFSWSILVVLTLFYLMICFNQYFFVPMYTKLPALFRYVYYSFTLPFALFVFLCWRILAERRYVYMCVVWVLFVLGFQGLLLQRVRTGIDNGRRYSPVGAGILMNSANVGDCRVVNSCQYDIRMAGFLNDSGIVKSKHRVSWWDKLRPNEACIMFYNGVLDLGKIISGRKINGDFDQQGFYYASATNGNTLYFRKLYCDEEALNLISRAYSDSNLLRLQNRDPVRILPCEEMDIVETFNVYEVIGKSEKQFRPLPMVNKIVLPRRPNGAVRLLSVKSFYCFQDDIVSLKWTLKGHGLLDDGVTAVLKGYKNGKAIATIVAVPSIELTDDQASYESQFSLSGKGHGGFDHYRVEIQINNEHATEISDIVLLQKVSGCLDLVNML